ncbi:hypothetical protein EDC01DRAFT_447226 [Geopyxis carbonaria]|nr:hypothetical protein EDC01DRAFT_447226 [Geopyxis carbonaria]
MQSSPATLLLLHPFCTHSATIISALTICCPPFSSSACGSLAHDAHKSIPKTNYRLRDERGFTFILHFEHLVCYVRVHARVRRHEGRNGVCSARSVAWMCRYGMICLAAPPSQARTCHHGRCARQRPWCDLVSCVVSIVVAHPATQLNHKGRGMNNNRRKGIHLSLVTSRCSLVKGITDVSNFSVSCSRLARPEQKIV